ncbi:hypothetical protein [Scytonema sp. NUACC26]|uniref:hypothetical protein n=1 Tax=Scytonema sp. NUACC26 TaxID=3140176 RepID=UPI0034DCB9B0
MEIEAVVETVFIFSRKGYSRKKVIDILNEEGVTLSTAFAVVQEVYDLKAKAYRDSAKQAFILGSSLLLVGLLISLGTYTLVAAAGGGFFIIMKGFLIIGCLSVFKGIWRFLQSYFI